MIKVVVGKPVKCSGIQSVLVSFPYNPNLVEVMKQFQPAI